MPEQNMPMNPADPQQQMQQSQGMFAQEISQKDAAPADFNKIASLLSDIDRRIRILEERYSNIRKKIQLTDQNLLESEKTFGKEMHLVNEDLTQMKRELNDFSDKITMFGSEMQTVAKKVDLKILEKYLALWSPKNYVTRNELREYLKTHKVRIISEDGAQDDGSG